MLRPSTTEMPNEQSNWHIVGTQTKKMNAPEAADAWHNVVVTDKPLMWRWTWQAT